MFKIKMISPKYVFFSKTSLRLGNYIMVDITVIILTKNEEKNLKNVLNLFAVLQGDLLLLIASAQIEQKNYAIN